jgi:hypothetical protein
MRYAVREDCQRPISQGWLWAGTVATGAGPLSVEIDRPAEVVHAFMSSFYESNPMFESVSQAGITRSIKRRMVVQARAHKGFTCSI